MDNLKQPAYPHITYEEIALNRGNNALASFTSDKHGGFTKLELASLMIAQGFLAADPTGHWKSKNLASSSVSLAKAILEEANK